MSEELRLAYCSYPYTENPKYYTEQIRKIAKAIAECECLNLVPIVPHLAFDNIFGEHPAYSLGCMIDWEVVIIDMCPVFLYDPRMLEVSFGCRWELSIAKFFKKEIYTYAEVLP